MSDVSKPALARRRQALLAHEMEIRPDGRGEHVHAANEFMLILKGSGHHQTNLGATPFEPGDIHFFPRGQNHEHRVQQGIALAQSVRFRGDALLSESEVDQQARVRLQYLRRRAYLGLNRLELESATTRRMKDLFERAVAEDAERESGYRCLLKGIALEMIVLVARAVGFNWRDRRDTGGRLHDVLEALEMDPTRKVTVEDMAKRAQLSRSQFHAAFKRIAGTTLLDHVTRLRVNVAQRLLVGSKMEIMDVCFESGFESTSRFYDVFKRYTGMAPGDYRKKMGHEV